MNAQLKDTQAGNYSLHVCGKVKVVFASNPHSANRQALEWAHELGAPWATVCVYPDTRIDGDDV